MTMTGGSPASVGREGAISCSSWISSLIRRCGKDPNNGENRAIALDSIRQVIDEFNLERSWNDRLITSVLTFTETSVGSGVYNNLYNLPSYFRKFLGRAWLNDTGGDRLLPVEVLSWWEYLDRITSEQVGPSQPRLFTVEQSRIQGQMRVWPTPSAGAVTTYPTADIPCYFDIPTCGDSGESLPITSALQRALFARALVIINDYIGTSERTTRFMNEADRLFIKAISYDNTCKMGNSSILRGYL